MVQIKWGKYASPEHRYNNLSVKEKEVQLKNDYDGKSMVLKDVNRFK